MELTAPHDAAVVTAANSADELMPKLTERGFRGGYIVPLPEPRIVGGAPQAGR